MRSKFLRRESGLHPPLGPKEGSGRGQNTMKSPSESEGIQAAVWLPHWIYQDARNQEPSPGRMSAATPNGLHMRTCHLTQTFWGQRSIPVQILRPRGTCYINGGWARTGASAQKQVGQDLWSSKARGQLVPKMPSLHHRIIQLFRAPSHYLGKERKEGRDTPKDWACTQKKLGSSKRNCLKLGEIVFSFFCQILISSFLIPSCQSGWRLEWHES